MLALPVFARRFFRQLFTQIESPWLLVFDNFQELPQDSLLLELIVICLQELPLNCRVALLSRQPPPPVFAKMLENGALKRLDAESLQFTQAEIKEVMALHEIKPRDEAAYLEYLTHVTAGWAAGLTLLLKEHNGQHYTRDMGNLDHHELFDYFTGVIISKLPDNKKHLLVQAALLPEIRPDIIDQINGTSSSKALFTELSKQNFFTYALDHKGELFQFHPLFKAFLRKTAVSVLSSKELDAFHDHVVEILVAEDRKRDAIELLNRAGKWQSSIALIKETGLNMLEHGHFKTLLRWQQAFPQEVVKDDPWLLFFFGNATTAFNPPGAIAMLEQSFDSFQEQGNIDGALLACASLTTSIINHLFDLSALDPWLDYLEQHLDPHTFRKNDSFESISLSNALFRGLVLRRPAHPDIDAWLKLVIDQGGTHPAIITHYLWTGRFPEARAALDHIYAQQDKIGSKLQLSAIKAMEVQYYLIMNEPKKCQRVIDESLQMINETGIRIWKIHFLILGAGCHIKSGKHKKAAQYLHTVEKNIDQARLLERSYYHVVKTLQALLAGDLTAADRHQQSAVEMATTVGMPSYETWCRTASALVAVFQNNQQIAISRFDQVFALASSPGNPWFTSQAHLGLAYMSLQKDDKQTAIQHLQQGLQLARQYNYPYFFFLLPKIMNALAITALEENIEAGFARRLIIQNYLTPYKPPVHLATWPWPLRIYTLGSFSIIARNK